MEAAVILTQAHYSAWISQTFIYRIWTPNSNGGVKFWEQYKVHAENVPIVDFLSILPLSM